MWRLFIIYSILFVVPYANAGDVLTEIEQQIIRHEDFRSKVFVGPEGATLIGYGRNIKDKGITKVEALMLLRSDIKECEADLYRIFGKLFLEMDSSRRRALIDIRYTLGPSGFREFKQMIKAIKVGDYALAAEEMKDSLWYKQVGVRGKELYDMMRDN